MIDRQNLRVAAFLLGALFLGLGVFGNAMSYRTSRWPAAGGVVIESRVAPVGRSGPDEAVVRYRYTVNGQRFEGDRIGYVRPRSQSQARQFVDDHPVGSDVTVFYDAAHPERAVLIRGVNAFGLIATGAGVALLIAGFVRRAK